jgi:hypothetical protein
LTGETRDEGTGGEVFVSTEFEGELFAGEELLADSLEAVEERVRPRGGERVDEFEGEEEEGEEAEDEVTRDEYRPAP